MQSVPIGPFDKSFDFFGDGSFYLVDAKGSVSVGDRNSVRKLSIAFMSFILGHCPGHMCGVVRIAPNQFIVLGGGTFICFTLPGSEG